MMLILKVVENNSGTVENALRFFCVEMVKISKFQPDRFT